jgi:hypothetical protein
MSFKKNEIETFCELELQNMLCRCIIFIILGHTTQKLWKIKILEEVWVRWASAGKCRQVLEPTTMS